MQRLKNLWASFFDIRPGEYARTLLMSLYLLFVLFAYYILKPVSRSLFLNKFDIDDLPSLYILIALGGGILAYLYSRLAVKASLRTAVFWAMALSVACLVAMWYLIRLRLPWMLYVLNVWVSLFSVVLVSQGWLVAANVFTPREAKRVYGLLGLGAVVGAAFGGEFTRRTVMLVGTTNLLLASAVMVILAYVAFRFAVAQEGVSLAEARAAETQEAEFSFRDIASAIRQTRHLQMIIIIISITFVVDVLVEYQFQAMAKQRYSGNELTAFFGSFYGLWLNLITFTFQFFLTAAVVRWFGVGGTLQIMPVSISIAAIVTLFSPGVVSAAAVRLTEAATRYTLNRTGMELLYLPLPLELKNRTKAFVDIFVDRMARGLGGFVLVAYTAIVVKYYKIQDLRVVSVLILLLSAGWMVLSWRAGKEYIATVRKRLESRRLDLESARITVGDPETIRVLEQTVASANPRQAAYALSLLAETPSYDLRPILRKAAERSEPEVCSRVYEIARTIKWPELIDRGLAQVREAETQDGDVKSAVAYVMTVSPDARNLAREFLDRPNPAVAIGTLEALASDRDAAGELITREWLTRAAESPDPGRRAVAAYAVGVVGDQGTEILHRLLADPDLKVVEAAGSAAGKLQNRAYLAALIPLLGNPRLRRAAIEALSAYGARIIGTLGDLLEDDSVSLAVRRQVPRVLKLIPHQRSVDVLLHAMLLPELGLRAAALKALNSLREKHPNLDFGTAFVTEQIMEEVRRYQELSAAMAPFRDHHEPGTACNLLARTLQQRLEQSLERMFRLLGLRYPPKEIYSAYLAVHRRGREDYAAAIEFLDNLLERELKRVLLPLLDAPENALQSGGQRSGVRPQGAEAAIRDLIHNGDPWLVACAVAAAAELHLHSLKPDIAETAQRAGADVAQVARAAEAVLA
jgi:AAA family ATP:ADP antiporter